jgi:hypothetical protein
MILGSAVIACMLMVRPCAADKVDEVTVTLEADRTDYFLGEPVLLKFGVKNVMDHPIKVSCGGDYRGGTRAGRFHVTATDDRGVDAIDPDPIQILFGGLGGSWDIAPGATAWMPVSPLRYRLIINPGTYTIHVGHDLGLFGERIFPADEDTKEPNCPTADITLRFKVPDESQAAAIVDRLLALKDDHTPMIGRDRPTGDISRDLGVLRLPVYLKPLRGHLKSGPPEIIDGIASIETPQATRVLLDALDSHDPKFIQRSIWPLTLRVPGLRASNPWMSGKDKTGRYEALASACWRPEFTLDLRRICVTQLKEGHRFGSDGPDLENACRFLRAVGEKDDAPAVFDALESALDRNDRSDSWMLSDPKDVRPLLDAAIALIGKGASPPDRQSLCGTVVELDRIRLDPKYRPTGWTDSLTAGISDQQSYVCQLALQTLSSIPEPLVPEVHAHLPALLRDHDRFVQMAAMQAVAKSGDRDLAKTVLDMIGQSSDAQFLTFAGGVAVQLPLRAEWMELCAKRLCEAGAWNIYFPYLLTCLDGVTGGGSLGVPSSADAQKAQQLWIELVALHRDEIAAGKKISIDEVDPALVPPPISLTTNAGGNWPR